LGLVGGAEEVGIGGIGLFGGHAVVETGLGEVGGHLGATAQLVDESLIEPGFVDLQVGIDEETVAVEALDVVAFEGTAVAPDVDAVLLHGGDEDGAGGGAGEGGGVEVGEGGGGDVESAALEGRKTFADELGAAVDEAGLFGAVGEGAAGDVLVVGLVGLAKVGGVGVGDGTLGAGPVE